MPTLQQFLRRIAQMAADRGDLFCEQVCRSAAISISVCNGRLVGAFSLASPCLRTLRFWEFVCFPAPLANFLRDIHRFLCRFVEHRPAIPALTSRPAICWRQWNGLRSHRFVGASVLMWYSMNYYASQPRLRPLNDKNLEINGQSEVVSWSG